MNQALVRRVWERAGNRCEYCRIPHPQYRPPFQIDHIIARQHGGTSSMDNLALACLHCNRHKGPNLSGWDSDTGEIVRLFHPRMDVWGDHFLFTDYARIDGKTSVGRVTAKVLALNADDLLSLRTELLRESFQP